MSKQLKVKSPLKSNLVKYNFYKKSQDEFQNYIQVVKTKC